jgi:hypothetical protein
MSIDRTGLMLGGLVVRVQATIQRQNGVGTHEAAFR